jgi:iron(III) transport system permease protein
MTQDARLRYHPPMPAALVTLAVLAALVLVPLAAVVVAALASASPSAPGLVLEALAGSVAVALTATVVTVPLAVALAWTCLRASPPWGRRLGWLWALPPGAAPLLAALAVRVAWPGEAGFAALVTAQVLAFLPHASAVIARALVAIEPAQEEVAESLGAGPLTTLRRVVLRQACGAVAAAALGVAALSVGDLATAVLVGGELPLLATRMLTAVLGSGGEPSGGPLAATLAVTLLVPALAARALGGLVSPAEAPVAPGSGRRGGPAIVRWTLGGLGAAASVLVALAGATIVVLALSAPAAVVSARGAIAGALARSLVVAAVAALAGAALAGSLVRVEMREPTLTARAARGLVRLSEGMPGLVLGLGYLVAGAMLGIGPAGALGLAAASIVAERVSIVARGAAHARARVDHRLLEAAESCGAGRGTVLRRVVGPLVTRDVLAVTGRVAAVSLVTVNAVALTTPWDRPLGAVSVLQRSGPDGAAAGTILLVLVALAWGADRLPRLAGGAARAPRPRRRPSEVLA